jgi:ribonuclease Z
MIKNAPYKTFTLGKLTVEGYSRAAVQTYWRIPELKLGFDLGAHPWDFMGTPNWMLSHCHLDHIAALPLYVARRRLMKMCPPKVVMPSYATDIVRQMLNSFEKLDRGRLPCELIGIQSGEEIALSREIVVRALGTSHTVPSIGYVVYERRLKLKPQYVELSGEEIRILRAGGTQITDEIRIPLVAYTGDTSPQGLDDNPVFYEAKILITELTFMAPDHRKRLIHKSGHMHLDDIVQRQHHFKNELIVAGHCSTRYNRAEAEQIIRKALPDMMENRLQLCL